MKSVNDIRQSFLDFFGKENHEVLPSGSLVPHNDPTLMFTNAGMVQFKNIFTGVEKSDVKRAATSQKCVRAGGKHNDLDNVGYTARHHTFFEMLGNFSFGDYFKENAIELAWKFLTKEVKIPKEKLLTTVYHTDDEAFNLWKKISGLPENKIIRIPTNDNFWAMGDTGPCGPCSEIFYDHGKEIPGGPPGSADADGDRFIEIWNLVFMQYEQLEDGKRINLPKPSIDTGMGLERISAVLQGVHDNYSIDLFKKLISASKEVSGNKGSIVSHRIIADHLRSSCFLIADGVLPSNEGRGYVLRRIMRRAMRHAHQLGCKEPLMYKLVPTLIELMGKQYQELYRAQSSIVETLKQEEEKFKETLERGLKLLEEETAGIKKGGMLKGETAFKLYDTYGFPVDLTEDIMRGKGIGVDQEGFNRAMQQQKEKARAAWAGSGEKATDKIWFSLREQHGITEFLGYDLESAEGRVLAIVKNGEVINSTAAGDEVSIITNQTAFYAESGGQIGDTGAISNSKGLQIKVVDTRKFADLHVHFGKIISGSLKREDIVTLKVDHARRSKLRANHSATHILHSVLRRILGTHITQKGSLVAEDKLRFDISHPKAIAREEIIKIENEVNRIIRQNTKVMTKLMRSEDAIKSGAMALFGEKYADEVRVVSMGLEKVRHDIHDEGGQKPDYSIELCGGTHVKRAGDIGFFKIVSESAVAAGVRRIEALTGEEAVKYAEEQENKILVIASKLKSSADEVESRIEKLVEERRQLEKELAEARKAAAMGGGAANSNNQIEEINGIKFVGKNLDIPPKDIKSLVDDIKKQISSGVIAVISTFEGKVSLVVGVTGDLTAKINAVDLVRAGAEVVGGKGGGGRPDMAQAGGSDTSKAGEALQKIKTMIKA